jgi:hypothetical protein
MSSNKIRPTEIIFSSKTGCILVSILLGLGLASIFREVCVGDNCVVITRSPPINEIEDRTFSQNGKCYQYKAKSSECKA